MSMNPKEMYLNCFEYFSYIWRVLGDHISGCVNHICHIPILQENEETLQEGQASVKNILEEGRHKTLIEKENQNNF